MAYIRGSLGINPWRDVPLLRQIYYSTVVSHSQLFQFMSLGFHESKRHNFNWRLRRLVTHGLVRRHSRSTVSRDYLYTITPDGIACLQHHGDYYLCSAPLPQSENEMEAFHLLHRLELNDIHLAWLRARIPCNWIPESRLLSLISQGVSPYAKAYDAVIEVQFEERQVRFALEYERSQKNAKEYLEIREAVEAERNVRMILYLMPCFSLMTNVAEYLRGSRHPIYFAQVDEFRSHLLETRIVEHAGIGSHSQSLREVLAHVSYQCASVASAV